MAYGTIHEFILCDTVALDHSGGWARLCIVY